MVLKNQEIIKKPLLPYSLTNNKQDLKIQLLDYYRCVETGKDEVKNDDDSDDESYKKPQNDDDDEENANNNDYDPDENMFSKEKQKQLSYSKSMVIKAYGTLPSGHSISLNLKHYQPFFYAKIPEDWKRSQVNIFTKYLKKKVFKGYAKTLMKTQIVIRKPFSEFTGDDKFQYLKLNFTNKEGFDAYVKALMFPLKIPELNGGQSFKYDLFESNIEPILKFLHITGINPSGWVQIPKRKYEIVDEERTTLTHFEVDLEWDQIKSWECLDSAPVNVAAFDIEADSSHGDFPMGIKKYEKLAQDLITFFNEFGLDVKKRKKHPFMRQAPQQVIETLLSLVFDDNYNNNGIHHIVTKNNLKPHPQTISQLSYASYQLFQQLWDQEIYNEDALDILTDQFEANLPAIDLSVRESSYYQLMAREIIGQMTLLKKKNNKRFLEAPCEVIGSMINLGFNDYYDGFNVNCIYTKHNIKPDFNTIEAIVPDILKILTDCSYFANLKQLPDPPEITTSDGMIYNKDNMCQDAFVKQLTSLLNQYLPPVEGDRLIQIGTTCQIQGQSDCYLKHIICLEETSDITNEEMIMAENQDIYLPADDLAKDLILYDRQLHSLPDLGKDELKELIEIKAKEIKKWDLVFRKLQCKKATEYRRAKQSLTDNSIVVVECFDNEKDILLAWKELIQINDPDMVIGYNIFGFDFKFLYERSLELNCSEEFCQLGRLRNCTEPLFEQKLSSAGLGDNVLRYLPMTGRVIIDLYKVIQKDHQLSSYKLDSVCHKFLYKEKVDISPQEIFMLQKGSAEDRKKIAVYCLVDCILCNRLINKLCIIGNNIAMSNVCKVPFPYLFLRGQGVKLLSLVSDYCSKKGFLLPVLPKADPMADDGYEGAIVLKPFIGIYFDPIAVADFNSLYPNSMISENISHDSFVKIGGKYDNLPGYTYVDIQYDTYKWTTKPGKKKKIKQKTGVETCRYAQLPNGEKSIIPAIEIELLAARKKAKGQMESETDPFLAKIYDGKQLAYKVVANSLYGQLGSAVSPIYKKELAASTTAVGRSMIMISKNYVEKEYKDKIIQLDLENSGVWDPKLKKLLPTKYTGMWVRVSDSFCVAGDTDSIFMLYTLHTINTHTINSEKINYEISDFTEKLTGLDAIFVAMAVCTRVAKEITAQLKHPQRIVFEKIVAPFILFAKKRYHGHYYTTMMDETYTVKSMGIALKRRDNAPIVKKIYGGTLEIIMKEKNIAKAATYAKNECVKLLNAEFPMEEFTITKALKSYYKKPNQIAHNVLANRQAQRDPGNRFQSNDRVPYAFIVPEGNPKNLLQGDKIETINFILQNKKDINYPMYLENQIIKPVAQIFDLVPGFENMTASLEMLAKNYENQRKGETKLDAFVKKKTQTGDIISLFDLIKQERLKSLKKQEICDEDEDIEDPDESIFEDSQRKFKMNDDNDDDNEIDGVGETVLDNYENPDF
jgi:DNA polymerase elongation subunit (family B)